MVTPLDCASTKVLLFTQRLTYPTLTQMVENGEDMSRYRYKFGKNEAGNDEFGLGEAKEKMVNLYPAYLKKTARAYLIPDEIGAYKLSLQMLAIDPFGIFALILTPTRELALQIGDQFAAFGRQLKLQCCVVIGGRHQMAQAQELSRRPHVLIATPGRLADHIESDPSGIARLLKTIRFLVLDEADRMLDGQYATQVDICTQFD
uniref:Helicase ATP-binding domain-containing protein n=1 Tax=Globodera pallida TaxID=36090 RepID=A0A183BVZ1_GLOPA